MRNIYLNFIWLSAGFLWYVLATCSEISRESTASFFMMNDDWNYFGERFNMSCFRNFVNMAILSFFSKRSTWLGFYIFCYVAQRRPAVCCRRFGMTYRPYQPKWSSDIPEVCKHNLQGGKRLKSQSTWLKLSFYTWSAITLTQWGRGF